MSAHFSEERQQMSRTSERYQVHRNLAAVIRARASQLGVERFVDPYERREDEAGQATEPANQRVEDL